MSKQKPEDYPKPDKDTGTKKIDYGYNPIPKEEIKPPAMPPPPPPPAPKPVTEEKKSN